jgi:hypothetical protein
MGVLFVCLYLGIGCLLLVCLLALRPARVFDSVPCGVCGCVCYDFFHHTHTHTHADRGHHLGGEADDVPEEVNERRQQGGGTQLINQHIKRAGDGCGCLWAQGQAPPPTPPFVDLLLLPRLVVTMYSTHPHVVPPIFLVVFLVGQAMVWSRACVTHVEGGLGSFCFFFFLGGGKHSTWATTGQ